MKTHSERKLLWSFFNVHHFFQRKLVLPGADCLIVMEKPMLTKYFKCHALWVIKVLEYHLSYLNISRHDAEKIHKKIYQIDCYKYPTTNLYSLIILNNL